jgi:mannose-1-phosphate guanylyltransferase
MYVVIMAGGGGTRLRPLSTADRPKPFLPLLPTGETLLQRTVVRLRGPELEVSAAGAAGAAPQPVDVFVVAAAAYEQLIEAELPGIRVIAEPEGRNTTAAIALATLAIERDDDEVMVVLPADHRIDPAREGVFRQVLRSAADHLATGSFGLESPLVTLGVEAVRPATEYGYLRPDASRKAHVKGLDAHPLLAFEEKPTLERATVLRAEPGTAWNAGMFLWRRRAIRAELERHAPEVLNGVATGMRSGDLATAYASLQSPSIDYTVMQPAAAAGSVVMAAMSVGWTDVGTWPALLDVLGATGIDGGVVEAGDSAEVTADDLVIDRTAAGPVVRDAATGTIVAERTIAILRRARDHRALIVALLQRCAAAENAT